LCDKAELFARWMFIRLERQSWPLWEHVRGRTGRSLNLICHVLTLADISVAFRCLVFFSNTRTMLIIILHEPCVHMERRWTASVCFVAARLSLTCTTRPVFNLVVVALDLFRSPPRSQHSQLINHRPYASVIFATFILTRRKGMSITELPASSVRGWSCETSIIIMDSSDTQSQPSIRNQVHVRPAGSQR